MVSRYGSDSTFAGNADGGLVDEQGNPIISGATRIGNAPLGYSVLNQMVGKFPNSLLNFPPPTLGSAIGDFDNPLPFFAVSNDSDSRISAEFVVLDSAISSALGSAIFDAGASSSSGASGSYVGLGGLKIKPQNALSGDSFTLTQRAPTVVYPKQKEVGWAVLATDVSGTADAPSEWTVSSQAIYYNSENEPLSTATIGSVTGSILRFIGGKALTGYTNGTAYVPDAATSVEMNLTLTATAGTVSSAAAVYISTMAIVPESGGAGTVSPAEGRVTLFYSSSGTWVVPTGVRVFDAILIGAGGGGASGALSATFAANVAGTALGGPPGGASGYGYVPNIPATASSTVTITIGSGGDGGTAHVYDKPAGEATVNQALNPATGGAGGASSISTSVGTVISITGGGGAGTTTVGAPGVVTLSSPAGVSVAAGTAASSAITLMSSPASSTTNTFLPFFGPSSWYTGSAGSNAESFGTTTPSLGLGGTVYADKGFSAGGAWGGSATTSTATAGTAAQAQNGGAGRYGAAGGGGGAATRWNTPGGVTVDLRAGDAGVVTGFGNGGSGGGGLRINTNLNATDRTSSTVYLLTGIGESGSNGYAIISYITPGTAV
jgi:hypothetical protein